MLIQRNPLNTKKFVNKAMLMTMLDTTNEIFNKYKRLLFFPVLHKYEGRAFLYNLNINQTLKIKLKLLFAS